jgi:predicted nucleotide-binding protein (sugar kinase/HSP70/actin superfamily)
MKIGLPRGLLFYKYRAFIRTFFEELGAELVTSPETNKRLLDEGVRCCVDEACLPVKVFHGHVAWLRDRCDAIFLPRLIGVKEKEYVCPMFCGLNEMIKNGIPGLPALIDAPIYTLSRDGLSEWSLKAGAAVTGDRRKIRAAFGDAVKELDGVQKGFCDRGYPLNIGLIGHAYNIHDRFVNMDIKKKLNAMNIGVMSAEAVGRSEIDDEAGRLFKKPFWTFARDYYGAAVRLCRTGRADGIVYLSSFSCGIDSVVTELIQNEVDEYPFMVLKLDEHTGQAGFDTRLEAFSDLLKRRQRGGTDLSQHGQYRAGHGIALPGA